MKRKLLALILTCATLFSLGVQAFAVEATPRVGVPSVNEIMNQYKTDKENILDSNMYGVQAASSQDDQLTALRAQRDATLESAGYDVYEVNDTTYDIVSDQLMTDLSDIGIQSGDQFLIVVDGYGTSTNSPSVLRGAGNGYTWNYSGKTYTLRDVYVYLYDDEFGEMAGDYIQMDEIDLTSGTPTSQSVINNIINTLVSSYIGGVNTVLGYVYSLAGVSLDAFRNSRESTLELEIDAVWERIYTQVWSSPDDMWWFGSCVGSVEYSSKVDGSYYDIPSGRFKDTNGQKVYKSKISPNYASASWRCNNAAMCLEYQVPCAYDFTGDVQFYHNNSRVATFYEPSRY